MVIFIVTLQFIDVKFPLDDYFMALAVLASSQGSKNPVRRYYSTLLGFVTLSRATLGLP